MIVLAIQMNYEPTEARNVRTTALVSGYHSIGKSGNLTESPKAVVPTPT